MSVGNVASRNGETTKTTMMEEGKIAGEKFKHDQILKEMDIAFG